MVVDGLTEQLMKKAREEGEVYIVTLTPEELRSTGFEEDNDFWDFEYVDIYLMYDSEYKFKYIFDGNYGGALYESESDVGGRQYFLEILRQYLNFMVRE
jgi:hypothetical protein